MKFTKFTLVALILALMVCAFVACGGDAPVETEGDAPVVTEPAETSGASNETEPATPGECQHVIVEKIDEPTCDQRGYKREICSICDEQLSVKPIDMIDHVEAAPATCTEGSVCKFCGTTIAAATGHTMGAVTDSKPATKTEAGYEKSSCTACGLEITKVLPAGITDNYNNLEAGALTLDAFSAASSFEGYSFMVTDGSFEVVAEGDNKYIKKNAPNGQIYYTGAELASDILEFTFDFRLDESRKATTGLLSVVSGGKEMRILNIDVDAIKFGINTPGLVRIHPLTVGEWVNVRVVLNTETFNYEVYINGTKAFYTEPRPDGSGRYDCYVLQEDGTFALTAPQNDDTLHNASDRSPFYPKGDTIDSFYFFHYSKDVLCSLDNVTFGFADAQ